MQLFSLVRRIVADRRGISAVEYGILIGVLGVAMVGVLDLVGGDISTYIRGTVSQLTDSTDDTQ